MEKVAFYFLHVMLKIRKCIFFSSAEQSIELLNSQLGDAPKTEEIQKFALFFLVFNVNYQILFYFELYLF